MAKIHFSYCVPIIVLNNHLAQDFSILALLTFGTGALSFVGSCPVHYKMFCSIHSLDLLETSPLTKMLPDIATYLLGGKITLLRTTAH